MYIEQHYLVKGLVMVLGYQSTQVIHGALKDTREQRIELTLLVSICRIHRSQLARIASGWSVSNKVSDAFLAGTPSSVTSIPCSDKRDDSARRMSSQAMQISETLRRMHLDVVLLLVYYMESYDHDDLNTDV